ncbi:hypothetical protein HZC00_05480 [Candidatus Kaiserbacteria bacterium]|nr:hypothetical protein [Candidatus Kaiserbacteria bacterium]
MKQILNETQNKIFILGAGASVDYGLPTWKDLTGLIQTFFLEPENFQNKYKKEILEWMDLVGEGKKYKTIDECIYNETSSVRYKENGQDIELEIFRILKKMFSRLYKKEEAWIKNLNEKIRKKEGVDWNEISFINFNYDNVLADNILDFSYLSKTDRERIHRERVESLRQVRNYADWMKIPCLYPHGLFEYTDNFLYEVSDTINSHNNAILESVSCYHGKKHEVVFHSKVPEISLYILGLGGGIGPNLKNILLSERDISKIKNIHVTVKREDTVSEKKYEDQKTGVIDFLTQQYSLQKKDVIIYNNCVELIENL